MAAGGARVSWRVPGYFRLRLSSLIDLVRFGLVGASGALVNLAVLTTLLHVTPQGSLPVGQAVAETVATQVAILWNFGLTEAWVFPRHQRSAGLLTRLGAFWSVSMVALAVQLPLGRLVDVVLGIGYIAATAVALVILVGARFLLCRAFLYGNKAPGTQVGTS